MTYLCIEIGSERGFHYILDTDTLDGADCGGLVSCYYCVNTSSICFHNSSHYKCSNNSGYWQLLVIGGWVSYWQTKCSGHPKCQQYYIRYWNKHHCIVGRVWACAGTPNGFLVHHLNHSAITTCGVLMKRLLYIFLNVFCELSIISFMMVITINIQIIYRFKSQFLLNFICLITCSTHRLHRTSICVIVKTVLHVLAWFI